MAYRIDYAEQEGALRAVVSGRSSIEQAARIAGDIVETATEKAAKQLLIDLRRLMDRVGTLGALVVPAAAVPDCRVAVLDVYENDSYYAFSEYEAFKRGRAVRLFHDPVAAARWLQGE